jgi:flagellar basal body-associated protein FliL
VPSQRRSGLVSVLGLLVIIAGVVLVAAGVVTYLTVSSTLADQKIAVSADAAHFGGQQVTQPWQAYAQANAIAKHADAIAGGKTYAELPQDDQNRQTVMTASFLQASLFTSVVAFGVALLAAGLGIVFLFIGVALRRLAASVPTPASEELY